MIVVGLGNPGPKYSYTRHNVGFRVIEKCAALLDTKLHKRFFRLYNEAKLKNGNILVEPLTYMNNSGTVFTYFSTESRDFVVIVDQMDLPVGKIKIKRGGSSAGHNGLKSIINSVGPDFLRIYVGVGRPGEGVSVVDHVLSEFSSSENDLLGEAINRAAAAVIDLLSGEDEKFVIQKYNSSN